MSFAAAPALLAALRDADLLAAVAAPAGGRPPRAVTADRELAREVARGLPLRAAGVPGAAERALATAWLSASHARVRAASRAVPASRWRVGAPGRWSAAQVVEHLVRTERMVLAFVRGPLLEAPRELALLVGSDAALVERLADRSRGQRCPEGLATAE
ncbi:MAG TPA: hypothetical protein VEZ47_05055, partial [Gemmatirosa sp.]|nr:hypothetical protein [Gemmatirosa sp.]